MTSASSTNDPDSWISEGTEVGLLRSSRLGGMSPENASLVVAEARKVLARCGPPDSVGSKVGLVVGYVQSGKTLNFTSLCALARDNEYRLIIVIAGTKVPLFKQSNARLVRDLQLETRPDRKWMHLPITLKEAKPSTMVSDTLAAWRDPITPANRRQTILITVMKHHGHLDYLTDTLQRADLAGVRAIVIDDEGDQAGLNARVNQREQSTTYNRLLALRACLPNHTYLQYTATPQAPLLINIIDALSPAFAEVLRPGAGYTGGQVFFNQRRATHVKLIPTSEIASKTNVLPGPPPTFKRALATFFVGAVAGDLIEDGLTRSMMVHPHQIRNFHIDYKGWTDTIKGTWLEQLTDPDADPEFKAEVVGLLKEAHHDLERTVPNLISFDKVMEQIPRVIRSTATWEVNARSGQTPDVKWRSTYPHILVGGQAMDRGFTVEGLTVTYMPRGPGEANADTVQQRARFFGYKESYLGFCRVWLESEVRDALIHYVEHEEDMRKRLEKHGANGKSLRAWRRAFFLDPSLKPTRSQVLDVAYTRGNSGGRWIRPEAPHILPEAIDENNALIDAFLDRLTLKGDTGHARRTSGQKHKFAEGVSLKQAYEEMLEGIRLADGRDSLYHTALLLQISAWLDEHPDATCSIYDMRPGADPKRTRNASDRLDNFQQGANPSEGEHQGSIYPGDRSIRHPVDLTIQVHTFKLVPKKHGAIFPRVRIPVVYLPRDMGKHWVVQ